MDLGKQSEDLLEEISETFNEMYVDCDEELTDLDQEKRNIELFLKHTFPDAMAALDAFKKNPSKDNLQSLESSIDLLNTQYTRVDHIGATAEHLVSSLAKLMDRLESYLNKIKEKNEVQVNS